MELSGAAEHFEAYGASHQTVLLVLVGGVGLLVWFGRTRRGTAVADRLGRALALVILALTLPLQVLYLTPGYWSLERTLPLQLCDLVWVVAVVALWTRRRWAAALTYYWGLTLATQAVITPDLGEDFPDPAFLLFWSMHLLIVWAAVYVTWGLGLSPDWRSYRVVLVATGAWALVVSALNAVAGTNYGYLREKPATGSVLDLLGPWPWYVLAETVVVVVVWLLMTWPWVVHAERRARPSSAPAVS
jgi:hypothetical integral membrane protein (TIGR02206 family)